jgi:hypothetical protein
VTQNGVQRALHGVEPASMNLALFWGNWT